MNEPVFWEIVDNSRRLSSDADTQAKLVTDMLVQFSEEDITAFYLIFREYFDRAYNWNLWAAAYIINCGCSDDGFTDFRAWLIFQGKQILEDSLNNPEILADYVDFSTNTQVEELGYVSLRAYEIKTGEEDMPRQYHNRPAITGEKWPEDEAFLKKKYPRLYAKFGGCEHIIF